MGRINLPNNCGCVVERKFFKVGPRTMGPGPPPRMAPWPGKISQTALRTPQRRRSWPAKIRQPPGGTLIIFGPPALQADFPPSTLAMNGASIQCS